MTSRYTLVVIFFPFTLILFLYYIPSNINEFPCIEDHRFHSSYQLQNSHLKNSSNQKYLVLKSQFHCDSGETNGIHRQVYWTIFAGRKNRLELQEKYWHTLKKKDLITEVHLWDFTYRNPDKKEAELSRQWIYSKSKEFSFIQVMSNPGFLWSTYYKHYANYEKNNSIIIKVDDDIIWINSSEFRCFVKFVQESEHVFLVSANVVNNEVIAFFQQKLGCFPNTLRNFTYNKGGEMGKLANSADIGYQFHKYFISHKSNFYQKAIIQFTERLNINFIAFQSENAKEINRYAYFNKKM